MKTVILLLVCVATVLSAPTDSPVTDGKRALPALIHEEVRENNGEYYLRYVTAEGTVVVERGRLVPNADGSDHVLIYEGEYTFVGTDGITYVTKYTTDVEGAHQPTGEHLPKAPTPEPAPVESVH